jgi:hypothetical protein
LLGFACLGLGGCAWGSFYPVAGSGSNPYIVTIHQFNTDDSIHACDYQPRGSVAHAKCVLGVVRLACHQQPVSGWAVADCDRYTNYDAVTCYRNAPEFQGPENCAYSMQRAIAAIRASTGECLALEHQASIGESIGWLTWQKDPNFGCP